MNFSNSCLATLRNTNHDKINGDENFTRRITKITPHHAAGIISAEDLMTWGHNPENYASWNYGIGSDGIIGLMTDECNRAWTSSSPSNDYQAVTIEVGNSTLDPDWKVSDMVWCQLVKLCVDICRRNPGIRQKNGCPGIYYDGTPNASLTFHEMFKDTICPGPYIKSRVQLLCDEVNSCLCRCRSCCIQRC